MQANLKEYTGLFLLGLLSSFGLFVVSPVLPLWVKQFGATYKEIGYFFTACSSVWVFLQMYAGHLADRYGRKRFIRIGLLIYGFFAFSCSQAHNFTQLLFFRMMQGAGLGLFGPAALGLVGGFKEKGKSFAIYRVSEGVGMILGPLVGGFIGDIRLSYPFMVSAIASLLAISSLFFVAEVESKAPDWGFFRSIGTMLKLRGFLLISFATFIAEMCFVSFNIVIPVVGESLHLSTKKIGFLLSSYFITFSLFQIPIGVLSERVSKKKLIVVNTAIAAFGFLALFLSQTFLFMSFSMALLGVTLGAVYIQASALIAEISPEDKKSLNLAFFDSVIDVSFVVMPVIVGYVLLAGEKLPFILCTIFMAISALIFSFTRT